MIRRLVAVVLALQAAPALAASVVIPHTFEAGKSLPAQYLNDNNSALVAGVNHVSSDQIDDGAVGAADLADNACTAAKIPDGSIGTAKIADGSLGNADYGNLSISTGKLVVRATTPSFSSVTPPTVGVEDTEGTLATLPSITPRGGNVLITGTLALSFTTIAAEVCTAELRLYRSANGGAFGSPIGRWAFSGVTTTATQMPLPTPTYIDQTAPAGAAVVYQYRAVTSNPLCVVGVPSTAPGTVYAMELA